MKNIHLIPTDKPSRLFKDDNQVLNLHTHSVLKGIFTNGIGSNQNIYITSNEEIKEGDWYFWQVTKTIQKAKKDGLGRLPKFNDGSRKIILTTDQELIKDSVQSIDDDFLHWFVKNPSCEFVQVKRGYLGMGGFVETNESISKDKLEYKIILPKEEPKQETLEEYISEVTKNFGDEMSIKFTSGGIKLGAKWQQERMYSEEEVKKLAFDFYYDMSHKMGVAENLISENRLNAEKWFEQFKKK